MHAHGCGVHCMCACAASATTHIIAGDRGSGLHAASAWPQVVGMFEERFPLPFATPHLLTTDLPGLKASLLVRGHIHERPAARVCAMRVQWHVAAHDLHARFHTRLGGARRSLWRSST